MCLHTIKAVNFVNLNNSESTIYSSVRWIIYNRYSYFKLSEVLKSLYFDRLDGFVLINNLVC